VLGLGENFPTFSLRANVSAIESHAFRVITDRDFEGCWKVYLCWPKDFTELSREEIVNFGSVSSQFQHLHAQLLGVSVESEFAHLAWRIQDDELSALTIPMLADTRRDLCGQLGILDPVEGVAQRAIFVVDPQAVIRFVYVTEMHVRRNVAEVLRVLSDLQAASSLTQM